MKDSILEATFNRDEYIDILNTFGKQNKLIIINIY